MRFRSCCLFVALFLSIPAAGYGGAADDFGRPVEKLTLRRLPHSTTDGYTILDLYPDITHTGIAYTLVPMAGGNNVRAELAFSTVVPNHDHYEVSLNGGKWMPVLREWSFIVPDGKTVVTVRSNAGGETSAISLERQGAELNVLPPDPRSQPRVPVYLWAWDDRTRVPPLGMATPAGATSAARCEALVGLVRELAASARVANPNLLVPFPLQAKGDLVPSSLQLATTIVAAAWSLGQPARLVVAGTEQRPLHLVEFYLFEAGKWLVFNPESGWYRGPDGQLLSASQVANYCAPLAGGEALLGDQTVPADDFMIVAFALENDFAANPRFRAAPSYLTLVEYRPPVEEYASLKKWLERIGVGLFLIAILGIIGIKLFSPESETDGTGQPPAQP